MTTLSPSKYYLVNFWRDECYKVVNLDIRILIRSLLKISSFAMKKEKNWGKTMSAEEQLCVRVLFHLKKT